MLLTTVVMIENKIKKLYGYLITPNIFYYIHVHVYNISCIKTSFFHFANIFNILAVVLYRRQDEKLNCKNLNVHTKHAK